MSSPLRTGVLTAILAAVAFGASTPLVQRAGEGTGPFATAALLYAGAAAVALVARGDEPGLRLAHLPRLLLVAGTGAFLAPVALAAGLTRTSGTVASLLLTLEAVFTVVLGALVHREPVGARVGSAVLAIAVGVALVGLDRSAGGSTSSWLGPALIALATLGWALDNTLSRPLADLRIGEVVAAKGALGAIASTAVALATGDRWPEWTHALAILACGAIGYGASLRLYLRAQRVLGAARTGSVFAVAPFVGAAVAALLGEPIGGLAAAAGALLIALGLWLHLGEEHDHVHVHEILTHDHPHRHDDDHHDDHVHDPPVVGVHSHVHTHEPREHRHPHGEDLHHRHHGSLTSLGWLNKLASSLTRSRIGKTSGSGPEGSRFES